MSTDSRPYVPVARPISTRSISDALYRSISAARYAPSAGNTQPWRWRVGDDGLDLFIDSSRIAGAAASDDRMAAVGCGAALQHARLALAALGWRTTVTRRPDAADPRHLARLHIDAVSRIGRRAVQAVQNLRLRHTDPRPVTGVPLGPDDLDPLTAAVEAEGGHLYVLRPEDILRLLLASAPGDDLGPLEAQWHDELARWAGRGAPGDEFQPAHRSAGQPAAPERAATFIVLHGPGDELLDWLRAGEALSAAWLAATESHLSVLPLSAPTERPAAREALRQTLGDLGHPYLVVRLGRYTGPSVTPRSPRLAVDRITELRSDGDKPGSR